MALTSGLAPSAVKTAIDDFVRPEFDREEEPQEALATNGVFFKQFTSDRGAEIWEEYSGVGSFTSHLEQDDIEEAVVRLANQKTYTNINYKRALPIPVEFFEDDMHAVANESFQMFGVRARTSRDKFAYQQSYGDAFSGVTTPDGIALISGSHTNLNGDTIDNLETPALSPAEVSVMIRLLRIQKAQDGELGAHNAAGLLVSPTDFKEATEITDSQLAPQTTDNQINYISNIYPGMIVRTSAYLDSNHNSLNSDTDTSFFIVGRHHKITRWKRLGLTTNLVPPSALKEDEWFYKARFREVVGARGWEGIVGSNGTT